MAQGSDAGTASALSAAKGSHTTTRTITNSDCVKAFKASGAARYSARTGDACTVVETTTVSAEATVGLADLNQASTSLNSVDYSALAAATASGTVHSRNYSHVINQVTDEEEQSGKFYYDGTHVWVTREYRGYTGSHHCKVNWEVGYDVANTDCSESGSTSRRTLSATWHFKLAYVIAGWDETYNMVVKADGGYITYG